jgi:hypothetical protein
MKRSRLTKAPMTASYTTPRDTTGPVDTWEAAGCRIWTKVVSLLGKMTSFDDDFDEF